MCTPRLLQSTAIILFGLILDPMHSPGLSQLQQAAGRAEMAEDGAGGSPRGARLLPAAATQDGEGQTSHQSFQRSGKFTIASLLEVFVLFCFFSTHQELSKVYNKTQEMANLCATTNYTR